MVSSCLLQSSLRDITPLSDNLLLFSETKELASSWFAYHRQHQTPDSPITINKYIRTPSNWQRRETRTPKNVN